MNDIDILDVVKLENNKKYVIASKVERMNKCYYQLSNINNPRDSMVCYKKDNHLVEVKDKELISILIPLFIKNLSDKINEI